MEHWLFRFEPLVGGSTRSLNIRIHLILVHLLFQLLNIFESVVSRIGLMRDLVGLLISGLVANVAERVFVVSLTHERIGCWLLLLSSGNALRLQCGCCGVIIRLVLFDVNLRLLSVGFWLLSLIGYVKLAVPSRLHDINLRLLCFL